MSEPYWEAIRERDAEIEQQSARIEQLEAALRAIMDCEELDAFTLQDMARAALAPEQEK